MSDKGLVPVVGEVTAEGIRRGSKALADDVVSFGEGLARLAEAAVMAAGAIQHLTETWSEKRGRELDD